MEFERRAAKALRRMPREGAGALRAKLDAVADAPFGPHTNVERIEGVRDGFRVRHGDWRALYVVDRERGVLRVERIGHRGEVYR